MTPHSPALLLSCSRHALLLSHTHAGDASSGHKVINLVSDEESDGDEERLAEPPAAAFTWADALTWADAQPSDELVETATPEHVHVHQF